MATYFKNSPICCSVMTGKLKGIGAINTNPLTNPFCLKMAKNPDSICHYCYSQAMLKTFRASCVPAFERNSRYLSERIIPVQELPTVGNKYELFRFNAHGEIINPTHAINLMNIVENNKDTFFGLWSKRANIVRKHIRRTTNANLIYSTNRLNPTETDVPEGFDKTFNVYTASYAKKHNIKVNCHGGCATCKLCYSKNRVRKINEIVKDAASGRPMNK